MAKKKKKSKWLDLSAFDDGYDFGDISETITKSVKKTRNTLQDNVEKSVEQRKKRENKKGTTSSKKTSSKGTISTVPSLSTQKSASKSSRLSVQYGYKQNNNKADDGFLDFLDRSSKKATTKQENERKWFDKGAFDDGYDFGDITKTILGTTKDVSNDLLAGAARVGEGVVDTVAYGVGTVANKLGYEDFANKAKEFEKKDLVGDYRIGEELGDAMLRKSPFLQNISLAETILNKGNYEGASLLGDKSDSLAQSAGQLAATAGLQAAFGIPWFVTTGVTSFGAGTEEAFQNDATYGEAGLYGGISAASELAFEKIGGITFGGKAWSEGLNKKFSSAVSNKLAKNLVKFGMDAGAEGFEEVATELTQNLGRKLTYEDEKTIKEVMFSEEAMDGYIEAFIGGAVMGGGFNAGKLVQSHKTGRDYDTGLTDNEQKVVDKIVEARVSDAQESLVNKQRKKNLEAEIDKVIAEHEKINGRLSEEKKNALTENVKSKFVDNADYSTVKLSKKEKAKIEEEVIDELKKGYIGIDAIEETLSGEKTSRINELKDLLNKTTEDTEKSAIEAELRQLEGARAEEMRGLLSKDNFLQESYRQEILKSEEFNRKTTKEDDDITKELMESAKFVGMNNTRKMHELFDQVNKIAHDVDRKYVFTNNERLKDTGGYKKIQEKISELEKQLATAKTEEAKAEIEASIKRFKNATVNGFVEKDADGVERVFINVDGANPIRTITGHETTHLFEGTKEHNKLKEIVKEYAISKGEYDARYEALSYSYDGLDSDIENELTADMIGEYLFTDEDFITNLSAKDPNIFQKVYDYIKHIYKMATAGSAEKRQLEQVKRRFEKAYKQMSKGIAQETKTNSHTEADSNTRYSVTVDDKETLDFLNEQVARGEYDAEKNPNGGYYVTYKSMSFWGYDEDGNAILRSPMAEYVDGKLSDAYLVPKDKSKLNWYKATETIDEETGLPKGLLVRVKKEGNKSYSFLPAAENQNLIEDDWSNLFFKLKKKVLKNGKWEWSDVPARYNPYEHSSNSMLNDQFETAYLRDNLVTVKMYVPVSEDGGAFRAKWSKDPTGWSDWKTGIVAGKIGQQKDYQRRLYLSRYAAPVEIVSDSEVAQAYKGYLEGTDVEVPDNVVSPNLLKELRKAGVPIKESGKVKYSISDTKGRKLTKGQQEKFKDSKMRDDDGRLKVMYHGSEKAGFHTFDSDYSDDGRSFFFTDDNTVAKSYSGTHENYVARTFKTVDDINNFFAENGLADEYEIREENGEFVFYDNGDAETTSDTLDGIYEEFKDWTGLGSGSANYEVYLDIKNPLVIDADGRYWDELVDESKVAHKYERVALSNHLYDNLDTDRTDERFEIEYSENGDVEYEIFSREQLEAKFGSSKTERLLNWEELGDVYIGKDGKVLPSKTRDYSEYAQKNGYDGVIFKNIIDTAIYASNMEKYQSSTVAIVFNSNQIKSVANENPTSDPDIRYSFSSIGNSFFGDPNITTNDMVKKDSNGEYLYKQTEGYKNYVSQCLNNMRQTRADFDETTARESIEKQIDGIVGVATAMKKAGYDIMDYVEDREGVQRSVVDLTDSKKRKLFSSLEPNSDYFTSHDISTICDKRKNFAEIYDDIVRAEEAKGVPNDKRFFNNVDNYFYIHKLLADKGLTQPCRQCYVESMRKNLAPMAKAFIKLVTETNVENKANDQLYNQSGKHKGEIKSNNAKLREDVLNKLEEYGMSASDLSIETLSTEDGLAQLKIQAPLIYEAFNSFYGQSKPKMPKSPTPFRFGELTALLTDHNGKISKSRVDSINSTGGFRLQSYSDFQIENFVDVLQVIYEAGTLGLTGHAYTKVPAFLEATEGTNLKRNISIFMYKDGDEWKIDRNDSFPYTLEEIYDIVKADKTGNTGIIAVSQNADMSAWIMANDFVGYGIPFHKSGLKMGTVRDTDVVTEDGRTIKGYKGTIDHTKQQAEVYAKTTRYTYEKDGEIKEKVLKENTNVKKAIDIYDFWDFENKDNLSKNELIEKNVKEYINRCIEAGYKPKFRAYVENNGKVLNDVLKYAKELGFAPQDATISDISFEYRGYTIPYGYYKFLGDFEMFDPDGNAAPQKTLSLESYDFGKAETFFKDAEKLRREEILQQFANGTEREKYRNSDLDAGQLQDVIKERRNEIVNFITGGNKTKYSISDNNTPYNADVRRETGRALTEADLPYIEQQGSEALRYLTDEYEYVDDGQPFDLPMAEVDNPFEDRNIDEVGNRKVKAYMYENPEVKPFFQRAAEIMLKDLRDSTKGERFYNGEVHYATNGEIGFFGSKRHTSDDIAYLLDKFKYTYADIEKGLQAIIEDNGKENNAISKRIEFLLDERLREGYTDFMFGNEIEPDADYINLLREKQITEYNDDAFNKWVQTLADEEVPAEDIAPVEPLPSGAVDYIKNLAIEARVNKRDIFNRYGVKSYAELTKAQFMEATDWLDEVVSNRNNSKQEVAESEDIAPVKPRNADADAFKQATQDNIKTYLDNKEKPKAPKEPVYKQVSPQKQRRHGSASAYGTFQSHFINRNYYQDKLSKEAKRPEIKFKGDRANNIAAEIVGDIFTAQTDNYGNAIGKALDAPFEKARNAGLGLEFNDYLLNLSNIERHAQGKGTKVPAEVSKQYVEAYEEAYPFFKEWAKDVYTYNQNQLNNAVDGGLINFEFMSHLINLYGHYVPVYSAEMDTPNIDTSPDEIRAGRPIKRAIGGAGTNLLSVEQAMMKQTYAYKSAIAKNDLYKEILSAYGGGMPNFDMRAEDSPADLENALYMDDNGVKYLTAYIDGEVYGEAISDELYAELKRDLDAQIKEIEEKYGIITKPLQAMSQLRSKMLTTYNPVFAVTNPIKDLQDALLNSKHTMRYVKNIGSAFTDSAKAKDVDEYARLFKEHTGEDIHTVTDVKALDSIALGYYKDWQRGSTWNKFMTMYGNNATQLENSDNDFVDVEKLKKKGNNRNILNWLPNVNNFMEVMFRYPEFKATLEKGKSVTEALYNAREVTVNFGRGGTISKAINRNGATFFNTSVQGMDKFFRNFSGEDGAKGFVSAVSKAVILGMTPAMLNHILLGGGYDDEYEALPEYVKSNYYLFRRGNGEFIRIPKGRMLSVLGSAARLNLEASMGKVDPTIAKEVDNKEFLKNTIDQIGTQNPLRDNLFAPIIQAHNNEAWYGDDLVPSRLAKLPTNEQYDASTDEFSKWLGEKLNVSPYKVNYVVDQYAGGIGDIFLPMITPEGTSNAETFGDYLLAPIKDKFVVNSTDDNKYAGQLYDLSDRLKVQTNSSEATLEDIMQYEYINDIASQMNELYAQKREIQNDDTLTKPEKYEETRKAQELINDLAKEGLDNYKSGASIEIAYELNPEAVVSKAYADYQTYKTYSRAMWDIYADKDKDGKSIIGSRKDKIIDYLNETDLDYGERIILFKQEYPADDTYNEDIIDYLNSRDDLYYEDVVAILESLGFTVRMDGTVEW